MGNSNRGITRRGALGALLAGAASSAENTGAEAAAFELARRHAGQFDAPVAAARRVLDAWLRHADARTLLLPDRVAGDGARGLKAGAPRVYTPHNSGADLYPYLVLTAEWTDPALYRGRMIEMLRNEVRYTCRKGSAIPANLDLGSGELGPPSMFGAGEYAKDGLLTVTEYLGRTPWFYRMVDLVAAAMEASPVESRFGRLPASDAELNGDFLQALARLIPMTGEKRFSDWGLRLMTAYCEEVLPGNHGVPSSNWDFAKHTGDGRLKLRDHGNEAIVGLVLLHCVEPERTERFRPALRRMLDRVLESANPDGLLYDEVDAATLQPLSKRLSDNWGYVYGAVYSFYLLTGETRYRDAVRRVLANLPKYHNHDWENGSFDGIADSVESAIYLVNREPVPEAIKWIDEELARMLAMQRPDGHIEYWYGEGNFNRTALLYALWKSQGCRPPVWKPGWRIGAARDGQRLCLHISAPMEVRFDFARHRRVLNLSKNYVRLNEFPEWFTVEENALYRLRRRGAPAGAGMERLGSELIAGVELNEAGDWLVEAE